MRRSSFREEKCHESAEPWFMLRAGIEKIADDDDDDDDDDAVLSAIKNIGLVVNCINMHFPAVLHVFVLYATEYL